METSTTCRHSERLSVIFTNASLSHYIRVDDPDNKIEKHEMTFRRFLKEKLKFVNVVTINDEKILESIHLNYRLSFLKDTVIATIIDDSLSANITQIICMNNLDIVNHFFSHKELISELFERLREDDMARKSNAIHFLLEICQMSKNLHLQTRHQFMDALNNDALFELLAECLALPYESLSNEEELDVQVEGVANHTQNHVAEKAEQQLEHRKKVDLLKINAAEVLMNCLLIVQNGNFK